MGIILANPLSQAKCEAEEVYKRGNWPRFFFTNGGKGGIRRKTYKENSLIKARTIAEKTTLPVLADDSGLEIKFLGKHCPGIFTKRFSEQHGGQAKTNEFLSKKACKTSIFLNKAVFTCCLTLLNFDKKPTHFVGKMRGKISTKIEGINGFGYDPIFIPNGYKTSVASLSQKEKNMISHRYHALMKLVKFLNK